MPTATENEVEALRQKVLYGDLITRAEASDQIADYQPSVIHKDWIVTICDKYWRPSGEFGDDMLELTGVDPRNNLPSATLKIKGDCQHIEMLMNCMQEMVGVTVETGGLRYAYYVKGFDLDYNDDQWTGTVNLLGIWDILNYLIIWPNFLLPIQAQIPSHAIFIWGLCSVVESMVGECSFRIQSGIWEFINNALSLNPDFRAWFGTLLQSQGNIFQMLKTPVYVVHTNPFLDTSPLVAKTIRMESCGTAITDITKAYGVDCRMELWLPAGLNGKTIDDPQPDQYAHLKVPTYVFTAKDRSQIEGPTKTVLDSVIRSIVDLGGSIFQEMFGVVNQVPGMNGVFESPLLGVNFIPPWAILIAPEPGKRGSVSSCKLSFHTQAGWQHIIGGRSPKWLNDFLNATFAWIIDSISILIGFTGIPSNLLEGFLNNAFLAFQLIQVYERRDRAGPYHPAIETMSATASAPYNIETLFAFINKIWDTRGYVSAQATFRNGEVYTLGKDVFKGGLMSVLYHGRTKLFTDYVELVMFRITPKERDVMVQIGDGKAEESPLAKHQRFITGIFESLNVLTLAPQSGGLV
jgi:hypothetical protein